MARCKVCRAEVARTDMVSSLSPAALVTPKQRYDRARAIRKCFPCGTNRPAVLFPCPVRLLLKLTHIGTRDVLLRAICLCSRLACLSLSVLLHMSRYREAMRAMFSWFAAEIVTRDRGQEGHSLERVRLFDIPQPEMVGLLSRKPPSQSMMLRSRAVGGEVLGDSRKGGSASRGRSRSTTGVTECV